LGIIAGEMCGVFGRGVRKQRVDEGGFSGELSLSLLLFFFDFTEKSGDGGHGEHGLFGEDIRRDIFGVCGAFVVFVGESCFGASGCWRRSKDAVKIGPRAFGARDVDVKDGRADFGKEFVDLFDLGYLVGFAEVDHGFFFGGFVMRGADVIFGVDKDHIFGGRRGGEVGGMGFWDVGGMREMIGGYLGGGFGDGLGRRGRDKVFDIEQEFVEVEWFAEDFVHAEVTGEFAEYLDIADKDRESGDKDDGACVALLA